MLNKNISEIQNNSLHDVEILDVKVSSQVNYFDTVYLTLRDDKFIDQYGNNTIQIVLRECCRAQLNLNMYILGKDTIRLCTIVDETLNLFNEQNDIFKHFHIDTNTTASFIDVYAKEGTITLIK